MPRRRATRYEPPPTPSPAAPPARRDPLAFLDDLPPILTLDEAAGVVRREPRSCLEDPSFPRLPYNRKEIRVLREDLRAWLEGRRSHATAAFLAGARLSPSPLDDDGWAALLRLPLAEAREWLAAVRGEGAAD